MRGWHGTPPAPRRACQLGGCASCASGTAWRASLLCPQDILEYELLHCCSVHQPLRRPGADAAWEAEGQAWGVSLTGVLMTGGLYIQMKKKWGSIEDCKALFSSASLENSKGHPQLRHRPWHASLMTAGTDAVIPPLG